MLLWLWEAKEMCLVLFVELPREIRDWFRCWAFHCWRDWYRVLYADGSPSNRIVCAKCGSERYRAPDNGPPMPSRPLPSESK